MIDFLPVEKLFLLGFSAGLIGTMLLLSCKEKAPLAVEAVSTKPSKQKKIKGECKMVFVVRKDLKATKRDIAKYCVHGCIEVFKQTLNQHPKLVRRWMKYGQTKVALKVQSEAELLEIQKQADDREVVNFLARETEQSHKSAVLLAIGPDCEDDVNAITGHLKLY